MSSFRLIDADRANYPVAVLCRMLEVSKSGYAWRSRAPSKRSREDYAFTQKIREVHRRSGETYGSPRSKKRRTTRSDARTAPAPDLLRKEFVAAQPKAGSGWRTSPTYRRRKAFCI
jgi:hypothetical protein